MAGSGIMLKSLVAFRVSTPEGQKSCAATRNETGGPAFAEPPGITGFFEVFRPAK
jgi:hypothetical protein